MTQVTLALLLLNLLKISATATLDCLEDGTFCLTVYADRRQPVTGRPTSLDGDWLLSLTIQRQPIKRPIRSERDSFKHSWRLQVHGRASLKASVKISFERENGSSLMLAFSSSDSFLTLDQTVSSPLVVQEVTNMSAEPLGSNSVSFQTGSAFQSASGIESERLLVSVEYEEQAPVARTHVATSLAPVAVVALLNADCVCGSADCPPDFLRIPWLAISPPGSAILSVLLIACLAVGAWLTLTAKPLETQTPVAHVR